jgi:hypothetical protein
MAKDKKMAELICPLCYSFIDEETAVRIYNDGFICSNCCNKLMTGEDDDTIPKEDI